MCGLLRGGEVRVGCRKEGAGRALIGGGKKGPSQMFQRGGEGTCVKDRKTVQGGDQMYEEGK